MPKQIDGLTYQLLNVFQGDDHLPSEVFHESTKLNRHNGQSLGHRVDLINESAELQRMMWAAWKSYEGAPKIPLGDVDLGSATVEQVLRGRRSQIGAYSGEAISFQDLASILRFTYGPTLEVQSVRFPGESFYLRGTPSAGGLYPLEIYPLAFNVDGLEPGLYHYSPKDHSLEVLRQSDTIREEFVNCTSYVELASTASAIFVITGVLRRNLSKYMFRGYRFLSYDVGACLQSFYLCAGARGLSSVAIGGFFDNMVGDLVGIDNVEEQVLMNFSVGHPRPTERSTVGKPVVKY